MLNIWFDYRTAYPFGQGHKSHFKYSKMKDATYLITKIPLCYSLIKMKHRILLLGFTFLLLVTMGMGLIPHKSYADPNLTTDINIDKDRQTLIAANQCFGRTDVIETGDTNKSKNVDEAYSNIVRGDGHGKPKSIVVGFDLNGDNGVDSCLNLMPRALAIAHASSFGITATDEESGKQVMLQQYVLQGNKFVANTGYKARNTDNNNSKALSAYITNAIKKIPPPNSDLLVTRIAPLVGDCFGFTSDANPPNFNDGKGSFKVAGLGTFLQNENIDWKKDFNWIHTVGLNERAHIGDITLGFTGIKAPNANFTEDNSESSSDFYPLGPEISQTTSYTAGGKNDKNDQNAHGAIVDCHFVKKNADWIFADHTLWSTDTNGNVIFKGQPTGNLPGGTTNNPTGQTDNSCESKGGSLSWLLCPVLNMLDGAITELDAKIQDLLNVKNEYYDNPDIEAAWGRLRNIAYIILVPIMLIMVIGTALGFDFISAYAVKRALPRFLIAVLFITVSWEITSFLITFTNVVGQGVQGLITSSVSGASDINLAALFQPDQGDSFKVAGFALWGLAALIATTTIGIILSYLFVGAVILFVAFLILAFRQFLIIALALVAPLAILAWIFPGNDRLWKLWWGSFSKLLLMFPLIALLIGTGKVFATIVNQAGGSEAPLVNATLKLSAYLLPYFFIPFTFKFAGGVFATVTGFAQDRGRGFFDKQRKGRQEKRAEAGAKNRNYSRFSDRNRFTRGLNAALGAGVHPKDVMRGRRGIRAGIQSGRINQGAAAFENDATVKAHQGDDNFLLALTNEDLAKQKIAVQRAKYDKAMAEHGADSDQANEARSEFDARSSALANARRVRSRYSNGTRLQALNALARTGFQFAPGEAGYKELSDTVTSITGGDMGAYSTAMNEAQYHLRSGGRLELAGINHGAGIDAKEGIRKLGNYARGQSKVQTYYGGAAAWLGVSSVEADGKTAETTTALAEGIGRSLANGETSVEDVVQWHSMLLRDYESATDVNKLEIRKQIDAIESTRAPGSPTDIASGSPGPLAPLIAQNREELRRISVDPSEIDKLNQPPA